MLKSLISKILGMYESCTDEQAVQELRPVVEASNGKASKPKLFYSYEVPSIHDYRVHALKYVQDHPKTTLKGFKGHISPKLFDRLVACGAVTKTTLKVKRCKKSQVIELYMISDSGKEILNKVNFSEKVDDFIWEVKKSGSKTLDEFDVNMTLFGDRKWVDPAFLRDIGEACWNNGHGFNGNSDAYGNTLSRKLQWEVPFMADIIEKHTDHRTGFLL